MSKFLAKQCAQAAKKQKDYRPDVGSGQMKQVMHYATSGPVRTAKHLKMPTGKPS